MNKRRRIVILSVVVLVVICVLVFASHHKIDENQVEKIVMWTNGRGQYELTSDETAKFIEFYNSSKYMGAGTGEGGTPSFGVYIYFHGGKRLQLNEFHSVGKDFEVSAYIAKGIKIDWYYINSEALDAFLSEIYHTAKFQFPE